MRLLTAFAFVASSGAALFVVAPQVGAAACSTPSTDMGTDTISITVPATATYTVWTRMKAPDASHNSISLEVDTTTCFNVGGGSFVATSWASGSGNWIRYQGGAASNTISLPLNAGNHSFKYIGTQAGVEIDRVILSSDASCTPVGTGDNCQSGDSTKPTVGLQSPVSGQSLTGNVGFRATAADASGIANVQFLVDGAVVNSDTTSPYEFDWNSANVNNGPHTIAARATDTNNNSADSSNVSVTVSNSVSCSGTPSVPSGVRVSAAGATALTITWNPSTPASGCSLQGYRVFRNGSLVGSPTGPSYNDTGLTPGVVYNYTVSATDTTNHTSAQSAAVAGTTSTDSTPPSVPGNLRSTIITSSSVALAWNASSDNGGIKDYLIYRNGTQVGTSTSTAFTSNGLAGSTSYAFTVRARDQANNQSEFSSALAVKTLVATGGSRGDLNGDHKVNLTDLSILLSHWNQTGVPITQGDVDGSGKIDLKDLSILLSNWGKTI